MRKNKPQLVKCIFAEYLRERMNSLQARLEDTKLATAIDNACANLPSDAMLSLVMEQRAANVTLYMDGEVMDFPSNRESLAETINDAVEKSIQCQTL